MGHKRGWLSQCCLMLVVLLFLTACGSTSQIVPTPTAVTKPAPTVVADQPVQPFTLPIDLKSDGPLAGKKIKIVSSLPRSGSKVSTDSMIAAYKMALEMINYRLLGADIELLDWDDSAPRPSGEVGWTAQKEEENATKAVNDPEVMVYLGTYNSGAAKIAIPILNKANLVMISPGNTYPGLTKSEAAESNEPDVYYPSGKRNFARVIATDDFQGAAGAFWAKQIGVNRVYILDDTEVYGHGIAAVFEKTARQIGLQVVGGPVGIDPGFKDYKTLAANIHNMAPDLVYYGGITENNAGKLVQDLRTILGPNVKIMGADGILEGNFIKNAGEAAEGTLITLPGVAPAKLTGRGADFYHAYKAKYGQEPEAFAGYAFENILVALNAIQKAGKLDREAIREAVFATRDFDGILGKWSFDTNGDTSLTEISGRLVRDKQFDEQNAVVIKMQ